MKKLSCAFWALPRFLTDPDTPGVEKLVISACRPEANICPPHNITNADICCNDKRGLEPMNLMYVKGWSRSLAALTVLVCMWDCPEFKQAGFSELVSKVDCLTAGSRRLGQGIYKGLLPCGLLWMESSSMVRLKILCCGLGEDPSNPACYCDRRPGQFCFRSVGQ